MTTIIRFPGRFGKASEQDRADLRRAVRSLNVLLGAYGGQLLTAELGVLDRIAGDYAALVAFFPDSPERDSISDNIDSLRRQIDAARVACGELSGCARGNEVGRHPA